MPANPSNTIPFSIDRNTPVELADQVAAGLRGAIDSGRFKPGDRLPGIREMARNLGTSNVVVTRAVKQLANEGHLAARRRAGIHVLASKDRAWRAHVLSIRSNWNSAFFAEREMVLTHCLEATNIRVTGLNYLNDSARANLDHLESALRSMNLSHVVLNLWDQQILEAVAKHGLPVILQAATLDDVKALGLLVRALICSDHRPALRDLAQHLRSLGHTQLAVLAKDASGFLASQQALAEHGINVTQIGLDWGSSSYDVELAEQTGYRTMLRILAEKVVPSALYVVDDHMARGAYTALLETGVRVPDDVQMIVGCNRGHRIGGAYEFTRIQNDPVEHGSTIAEAVIGTVDSPKEDTHRIYHVGPVFVAGQTTRPLIPRQTFR